MRDFSLSGLFAATALAVAVGFQGCTGTGSPPRQLSNPIEDVAQTASLVTFYNGGMQTGYWETDRFTSSDGKLYFYQPGKIEPWVLSGTYVLEPKRSALPGDVAAEDAARASARHKVSLYSEGVLVRTFYAQRFSSADGKLYVYQDSSNHAIVICGNFVVEPLTGAVASTTQPRFTVSLYSGSRIVRTWEVARYTSGSGKMYLYVPGFREPVVVSGSFLVEPK